MAVEVVPIADTDVAAAAEFLHANLSTRVPWARVCSAVPWKVDAPNHGFMLRDGQRIVGVHLAFYSQRLIAGKTQRFCNLGGWCVLPEFRMHSIRLIKEILAQDGYHFTGLSPNEKALPIHRRFQFRCLDTSAALIPHLPWPGVPGLTRISADPDVIERRLAGPELELYLDHAEALAAHHLVLTRGQDSCYVMYRDMQYKSVPIVAVILYVSNPRLFHRAIVPLTRYLLVHRGLVATLAELRIIGHRPPLSFKLNSPPKTYRSLSLEAAQIDYLYSELECVP